MIARRSLLAAVPVLVAAGCSPAPKATGGRTVLRFATDWKAEAEHGGFYHALATGEYARRGLDVTIIPGGPGANVPQLIATGAAELGIGSNAFQLLDLAKQQAPVKAVAACFQKDPQVLMAHPGAGVARLEDLKGDRPILVSASAVTSLWLWLKARYGVTDAQRRAYSYSPAPFIADRRSVQEGYVTSEPYVVQQAGGFAPEIFLLADHGYNGYAAMVLAGDALIAKAPRAVQAFVDATSAGWRSYLHGDARPADALILKDNTEMRPDILAQARDKLRSYGIVEPAGGAPIGTMTAARWDAFFDMAQGLGVAPADLDRGAAYSLAFLPAAAPALPGRVTPLVALQAAEVDYGGATALGPLSLSVAPGEAVSLIGPSGSGKSTALRLLAGLEAPTRGRVARDLARGETAVVFQAPTLTPWADALANVALPLALAGIAQAEASARAAQALAAVGLAGAERRRPAQLSGGMAMRVSLARALVAKPRLLLMDEPFAALDEITRRRLADDVLALWRASGAALVFVTHSVEEAAYMGARVVALTLGPGRIAGEVAVEAPMPREPGVRAGAAFRATVERASALLEAGG